MIQVTLVLPTICVDKGLRFTLRAGTEVTAMKQLNNKLVMCKWEDKTFPVSIENLN